MGACWSSPTDGSELETFPYRHVMITGASSGIGAALAVQLSIIPNITLTLIARHPERLQTVAAACRAQGATVNAVMADVSNQTAMEDTVHQAHKLAPLGLVIANAGVVAQPEHQDQLPDMMRQAAHTNIIGTLNTIVPAIQLLKMRAAAGCDAAVAIMSSVSALPANAVLFTGQLQMGMLPYAWSKQSLLMLGQGLEGELAGTGVKVFTICPGVVLTDLATTWTQYFMGTNTTPDKGANTGPSCSSPASSKAIDIDHHGNKGKTGTNSTVLVSVKAEGVLSSNPSAESDELRAAAAASAEETQEGTPAAAVALADKTQQGTPAAAADSKACPAASAPQQAASGSPDLSPSNVLVPANLTHKAKSVGSCSRTATKLGKAAPKPAAKTSAQASAEEELKKQFGAITPDEAAAAIIQGLASGQGGIIAFPAQAVRAMKFLERLPDKLLANAIRKYVAKMKSDTEAAK